MGTFEIEHFRRKYNTMARSKKHPKHFCAQASLAANPSHEMQHIRVRHDALPVLPFQAGRVLRSSDRFVKHAFTVVQKIPELTASQAAGADRPDSVELGDVKCVGRM